MFLALVRLTDAKMLLPSYLSPVIGVILVARLLVVSGDVIQAYHRRGLYGNQRCAEIMLHLALGRYMLATRLRSVFWTAAASCGVVRAANQKHRPAGMKKS